MRACVCIAWDVWIHVARCACDVLSCCPSSVYMNAYLSVCSGLFWRGLSVACRSVGRSIGPTVCRSVCGCVCLPVCWPVCLPACLYVCRPAYLCACLRVCLWACLSVCRSVGRLDCRSVGVSICLSVRQSVGVSSVGWFFGPCVSVCLSISCLVVSRCLDAYDT